MNASSPLDASPIDPALLDDHVLPAAIVDLDAFDRNFAFLKRAARGRPLRIASKSVRVRSLIERVVRDEQVVGVMTFSPYETAWLAKRGASDLLLAYPVAREQEARALVSAAEVTRVMVDHEDQVAVLSRVAQEAGVAFRLCIDLDGSLRTMGAHVGVRRSPIRSARDASALGRFIKTRPHVRLDSVMCYEAQVAGVSDRGRVRDPLKELALRAIKRRSRSHVARLRTEVVAALRRDGHEITLVNGGGTGSIASTSEDPAVTETTIGSGLYCPHLFDGYDDLVLRPALFLALPITRRPDPEIVTCFGGGYIASGPTGVDRSPLPLGGARSLGMEGFGEVQTPLKASALGIGDVAFMRPAKAGEPLERFGEVLVWSEGALCAASTYRGEGQSFG